MKIFSPLLFLLFFSFFASAQTVNISGQCITGTVALDKIADMDGKAAFGGKGTVVGNAGTDINVYWMGGSDNLWVIAFDGQPYFKNNCNTSLPPATGNASCPWVALDDYGCVAGAPLVLNGSGVLPVSLFGLSAREADNEVLLDWKTASESNNKGFEIQRSKDAINWNKIGFVNGALNSSLEKHYSFSDVAPLQGKNYYRLLQYDLDGKQAFSPVVNVDFSKAGKYLLSNNPSNGVYRLNIHSTNGATILVSDMTGRRLIGKHVDAGIHQIDISKYAQGTYLLRLQIGNDIFTEKLLKQ